MSCEGKSKATVTWKWQDEVEKQLESKKCPVQVILTSVAASEYREWAVKNTSGQTIYTVYGVSAFLYPNNPNPGQYTVIFKQTPTSFFNTSAVFTEPVTLVEQNTTGCKIEIFDSKGLAFSEQKNKQCPTYKIKCDDDCNEGEMKCECNHYPGYCCIPCSEIKAGVSKATSTLRQVRA